MKANQLLLQNLIDINPRTGIIKLHDKRMGLIPIEALGILRHDLINTLGKERAKGFLMRYGWACGKQAAESLKENYEWKCIRELVMSGTAMHTLEGIVTVEPDVLEIKGDHLYFTGYWKNSFEVLNHLTEKEISSEAVCWTLIGYASGYLTSAFEKEVVAYEKYCRGKGDADCYFVAETVAHCDEEHLKDLRYYKTESLQTVLEDVYSEIEQLNKNIIESEEAQNQLTELFLQGKDINETTSAIGRILGRSIVIDHYKEVYSSHFHCPAEEAAYQKRADSGVIKNEQDGLFFETFTINSHNTWLGNLTIIGKCKPNQRELLIIKRALMVFTIQMYHQSKMTESLLTKREHFFDEMIENRFIDNMNLSRQAAVFGFNTKEPHCIITLKILPEKMRGRVLHFLAKNDTEIDLFMKDNYIVIIFGASNDQEVQDFSVRLMNGIKRHVPDVILHIGSGRIAETVHDIGKSYVDATRICDFVQLTYPISSRVATYNDLEGIMMFLNGADHQELIKFYKKTIGTLVDYDNENSGNLLITLKSYLENNGNLQQTACDLHLSIAGLRYRIEKIESLSEIDLKTGSGRFNAQLATRIYFGLKIINSSNTAIEI
ncbi:XylR N-terminal domain-containing protein [Sporosarcina sp. 179-K 3D1 HS]|uniref:XylR N-terminal domain-containing protein n=1 Tax=Sporosarcina sp. 179-K 3D1 HS TaxID=3232169 RepID=UPI0039A06FB1